MATDIQPPHPTPDPAPWATFPRQLAIVLLIAGALGFFVFLTYAGQTLAVGFLIAFLLYRPIRWAGGHIRYRGAVAISHLFIFAGLIWIAVVGVRWLAESAAELQQLVAQSQATPSIQSLVGALEGSGVIRALIQSIGQLFQSAASLVGVAFIAAIFSFWLLNDLWQARGALQQWIRGEEARQIGQMLHHLDGVWLGYLTAQIIFGIVMTIASLIQYGLMGVPYPVLMAVLTGVLTLIPSIGGLIASLVVAVPCLVLGSTRLDMDPVAFTILVTVINIVITQVSYNFIAVPIVGRFVRLPAALVLISVLIGVVTGSFIFAFLVVPLLASLRILASFLLNKATGREPYPGEELTVEAQVGLFGQLMLAPVPQGSAVAPKIDSPPDRGAV
jgi:predicted PurR-regulated permease PerM